MNSITVATSDSLCPGCFAVKGGANPCPHCGYDEQAQRSEYLLPNRTLLHGQYLVGRVLGKPGGFGVTYLGWDLSLQTRLAIKEYLPREWATRTTDRATVKSHAGEESEWFRFGLDRFPDGQYAGAARTGIAALSAPEKPAPRSARTATPAETNPPVSRPPPARQPTQRTEKTVRAPAPKPLVVPMPPTVPITLDLFRPDGSPKGREELLVKQRAGQRTQKPAPA